jgi:hypothetical protein
MLRAGALRLVLALSLACCMAALAACGSGPPDSRALGRLAEPSGSPPAVKGNGPPLAWAESGPDPAQRVWMAYSSYCWGQTCADYAQPTERTDVPLVRTKLGSKMVFHLGFDPTSIGLQIPAGKEPLELAGTGRTRTWVADRSALLVLNATGAADEQASYVVEVTLGEPEASSSTP